MPSTHTCLLYHIIFATQNREPRLSAQWRAQLHDYLGGIVHGLDAQPQGVGGVADHVHLLISLKPTHCLSDFMGELKNAKSAWDWIPELDGYEESALKLTRMGRCPGLGYSAPLVLKKSELR